MFEYIATLVAGFIFLVLGISLVKRIKIFILLIIVGLYMIWSCLFGPFSNHISKITFLKNLESKQVNEIVLYPLHEEDQSVKIYNSDTTGSFSEIIQSIHSSTKTGIIGFKKPVYHYCIDLYLYNGDIYNMYIYTDGSRTILTPVSGKVFVTEYGDYECNYMGVIIKKYFNLNYE